MMMAWLCVLVKGGNVPGPIDIRQQGGRVESPPHLSQATVWAWSARRCAITWLRSRRLGCCLVGPCDDRGGLASAVSTIHQRLVDEHGLAASVASLRRWVAGNLPEEARRVQVGRVDGSQSDQHPRCT